MAISRETKILFDLYFPNKDNPLAANSLFLS